MRGGHPSRRARALARLTSIEAAILAAIAVVFLGQMTGLVVGARTARSHGYAGAGLWWSALEVVRRELEARLITWSIAAVVIAAVWAAGARWRRGRPEAPTAVSPRRIGVALLIVLVPCLVVRAALGLARTAPAEPLNVVWITIDTLRADHLGAYGYVRETSPSIDALARGGVRFEQAIVQWPKTTPSIVSMLSGTYPHSNGVTRFTPLPAPDGILFLAEILRDRGFATAAVSTHPGLSPTYNLDQGFESFVETWSVHRKKSARAADAAIRWISERTKEEPFFLWIHLMDPHARYEPPPPFHEMFVGDAHYDPSRTVRLNEGPNEDIGGAPRRAHLGRNDSFAYYVAQYDAEIRYVDSEVGRVLAALDERGIAGPTVVVLTADHGESLGEHDYYFEHGRLPYDDCLRVPLIVRLPNEDTSAGRVVAEPVELVGVVPTLLEILRIPAPKSLEGASLMPWIRGEAARSTVFAGAGYRPDYQRVFREGRWKLVFVPAELDRKIMSGATFELYDLDVDPGEMQNRFDTDADVAARMRRGLEERMERYDRAAASFTRATQPLDARALEELRSLGYLQ